MLFLMQQGELPKPDDNTDPDKKWGMYSLGDFITENWIFLALLTIVVIIVILYARHRNKERKKRVQEWKANQQQND